jgi:hypothetical protein
VVLENCFACGLLQVRQLQGRGWSSVDTRANRISCLTCATDIRTIQGALILRAFPETLPNLPFVTYCFALLPFIVALTCSER